MHQDPLIAKLADLPAAGKALEIEKIRDGAATREPRNLCLAAKKARLLG